MSDCQKGICHVNWKPGKALMPKKIDYSLPYLLAHGLDTHQLTVKQLALECNIPIATMYRCLKGITPFSLKNAMKLFTRLYGLEAGMMEFFNELVDHQTKGLA
jgi:hypothetical protein